MAEPLRLAVRLTPKGGRDAIEGWGLDPDGRPYLKARVGAPPAEGQANAALIVLLAKTLKVAKSRLRIVSGETARLKMVEIAEATPEEIARALGTPPAP